MIEIRSFVSNNFEILLNKKAEKTGIWRKFQTFQKMITFYAITSVAVQRF